MPSPVLLSWVLRLAVFAVAILPIGPQFQHVRVAHLLQPACHVARSQIGFKDHAGSPAAFSLVGPTVLAHDPVKVFWKSANVVPFSMALAIAV